MSRDLCVSWHILNAFNLSLYSAVFPLCWQSRFPIPLNKIRGRHLLEKYGGGIAILSVLQKLFE